MTKKFTIRNPYPKKSPLHHDTGADHVHPLPPPKKAMKRLDLKKTGRSTWNPESDVLVEELKTVKPGSNKARKIQNLINEQQGSTKAWSKKEYKKKNK